MFAQLALVTLGLGFARPLPQIPDFGGKDQIDKMKQVSFLVGEWKGEGRYLIPGREIVVESTEKVEWAAGGTCAFVVGRHWMKGPGGEKLLIHDAAAMLFYNLPTSKFRMRAQLANGLANEFDVEVKDKGIVWGLESENTGQSRFTMNLTEKGEWHEIGERSMDGGKTWTKYMEMTLVKVPSKG